MSLSELQRFADTLSAQPALVDAYSANATPSELAGHLRRDGYEVTDEEVEAAYNAGSELSDEQLDQVSGGFVGILIAAGVLAGIGAGGLLALGAVIPATVGIYALTRS